MLILSCCQSNSPKVGQTCSLNLNKENVVLHMQPADMPTMLFIVPNSKRSPAAAALFRASRGCRRRMERMRKWYYIKLARSAWGIRNKRIHIGGRGGGGGLGKQDADVKSIYVAVAAEPSWFVGLKLDRCLWNPRRSKGRRKRERQLRGEALVLRRKGERVNISIGI